MLKSKRPFSTPQAVIGSTLQPNIGYLKINMFPGIVGVDVARDIDRAIASFRDCDRLIVDLRGNSGGGIGGLRLMSYLTPEKLPIGYSLSRARAKKGYKKEELILPVGAYVTWQGKRLEGQGIKPEIIRRYGAGAVPAGSTLEDWPLAYDDLEPFYDTIEWEVGVSGKAGNIQGKIDPRGNIFEGPRRREYPMPALRSTEFIDHMAEAARRLGWHPFHPPAAINTQLRDHRPGCAYHGYCNAGGCHVSAKSSTAVTTIPAALATKNLTIFDLAHVTRIVADANGRMAGVSYVRNREEFFQPAKVVLLAGYTYENTRLLLLSKSAAYGNGLANNHGQVGKHFFAHYQAGVAALLPFDVNIWYGLPAQGITVDDFADDAFDHAGLGFVGGTSLHVRTERHPIEGASMGTFGKAPTWGAAWKKFVHENAARVAATYLQTSTFPYETCYLDLDPAVTDPLGDPVCRITTGGVKQNEDRAIRYAQQNMEQWFREAGAIAVDPAEIGVPALSTHAYGGTRMGDNPETNVVDRWGFSHEVPNLGILGASVMGTSGARNPTLTAQALAWRTADHLVKNWKSIAG